MSEELENKPVVGEDGELFQPDRTVDPEAYSTFLATHVHRDPLLYRIRENVKEWGCAYILVTAGALILVFLFSGVMEMFISARRVEDLGLLMGIIAGFIAVAFFVIRHDRRK